VAMGDAMDIVSDIDEASMDSAAPAILSQHHVWLLDAHDLDQERTAAECRVPLLNMSIVKSNHFFHDSGANRHIAHDRGML